MKSVQINKKVKIALLLPCLNEEKTVGEVIRRFRHEVPTLDIYLFDNGSTDRSVEIAQSEGAKIIHVNQRGKGHVVKKMFESVEADIYIMVDSDNTYDPKGIWKLLPPVLSGEADMTVGSRLTVHSSKAFRRFHRFGNMVIIRLINLLFGSRLTDVCSGYRVMNHQFVKNIPLLRNGFEVETELTIYSLIHGFIVKEFPLPYRDRPKDSFSKLRTFKDGYKVLLTIVWLARDLRPLLFFATLSLLIFLGITIPSTVLFSNTLLVPLSSFVLSTGFFMTGLILNTINLRFSEANSIARREMNPPMLIKMRQAS